MESLFSPAEYLTTFTTFIYGYVATQFLSGWSSMITHRKSVTISKEHLAWTIFLFALLMDIWWTSWRKTEAIAADNLIFYTTLITPFIFYFLSHLLFPDLDHLVGSNLKAFLTPAFRKVMVAMAFLLLSFLLSDQLFPRHPPQNIFLNLLGIGLSVTLIIFPATLLLRRAMLIVAVGLLMTHLYLSIDYVQPFDQVGGFSFVEYLTVFTTFIYGFVTWRFLEAWGIIIGKFRKLSIGLDYLPWTVMGFLLMLDIWWGSWIREAYLPKNILYFFLSLTVPVLFYFFSAVVFPLELLKRGFTKLNYYYFRNNRLLCLLFAFILISNAAVANLMEETDLCSSENLFRFFGIALATAGMFMRRLIIHRVILLLGMITIIVHTLSE